MQKIFIKYVAVIMTAAIFLILFINGLFTSHTMRNQQYKTFQAKIDQMIHTLENNRMELALLNENLDADYLTRARAAAYVMDRQEDVLMDVSKMQYLADLLNVDELHVIDENGFIAYGSVSQYVGIDMADHEQTRAFLALLDSDEEDAYLIQEPQPNAAEARMMQYVGVARQGARVLCRSGLSPRDRWKRSQEIRMTIYFQDFRQISAKSFLWWTALLGKCSDIRRILTVILAGSTINWIHCWRARRARTYRGQRAEACMLSAKSTRIH